MEGPSNTRKTRRTCPDSRAHSGKPAGTLAHRPAVIHRRPTVRWPQLADQNPGSALWHRYQIPDPRIFHPPHPAQRCERICFIGSQQNPSGRGQVCRWRWCLVLLYYMLLLLMVKSCLHNFDGAVAARSYRRTTLASSFIS